jgi:hypothetical protein
MCRFGSMIIVLAFALMAQPATAAGWKVGVARHDITPKTPGWMSGYAARTGPASGSAHPLWAKAVALEDASGNKSVLVTIDVVGIARDVEVPVTEAITKKTGIPRSGIALASSHTHCGPVVGQNLLTMYGLSEGELAKTLAYTEELKGMLTDVASAAVAALKPATLHTGIGRTSFAVNRRENPPDKVDADRKNLSLKGPVDHDVPVLVAKDESGKVFGIVTQYACHCTTLDYDKYSGDYAGYAQIAIEKQYPGAVALFAAGCGADSNPLPRRSVELAEQYGSRLAHATGEVVDHGLAPLDGDRLAHAFEEIPLKHAKVPTKAELEAETKDANKYIAARAKMLLGRLAGDSKDTPLYPNLGDDGKLTATYPYPVQVWSLGKDIDWVFLGGEVVVDYSLRLKRSNGSGRTWVTAYSNDVMAYIPSLRVLKEGGYEGATSMIYYGIPSPWTESVEEDIVSAVVRLIAKVRK